MYVAGILAIIIFSKSCNNFNTLCVPGHWKRGTYFYFGADDFVVFFQVFHTLFNSPFFYTLSFSIFSFYTLSKETIRKMLSSFVDICFHIIFSSHFQSRFRHLCDLNCLSVVLSSLFSQAIFVEFTAFTK